jgi:hypothetical protein
LTAFSPTLNRTPAKRNENTSGNTRENPDGSERQADVRQLDRQGPKNAAARLGLLRDLRKLHGQHSRCCCRQWAKLRDMPAAAAPDAAIPRVIFVVARVVWRSVMVA